MVQESTHHSPYEVMFGRKENLQSTSIDFNTSIFMTTYDDDAKLQEVLQVMEFFVYMDVILHI